MPGPLAVPIALGVAGFFNWLSQNSANNKAVNAQTAALDKAEGAIRQGADKAMSYQQPYLQNAGPDYQKLRGLVQGGYFQTPYDKSFQGQSYTPSGFNFNPSQGGASFAPWQAQGGPASYTPPRLPSQAGYTPQPSPQPPQGPTQPATQGPSKTPMQQLYEIMHKQTPQQLPQGGGLLPLGPPGSTGLLNYHPQTGQGNPLVAQGVKPADPKIPTLQDFYNLIAMKPWTMGRSGPLEGGMPRGGMF